MRIFIECTRTLESKLHTGIQRVVRRYLREGMKCADQHAGLEVIPVIYNAGFLKCLKSGIPTHPLEASFPPGGNISSVNDVQLIPDEQVYPGPDDILLLMDASWYVEGIWGALLKAKDNGCRLVFLCHDVIPVVRPDFFPEDTVKRFKSYWDKVGLHADQLICVSDTTRRQMLSCWQDKVLQVPQNKLVRSIAYNYLGGDFCGDEVTVTENVEWLEELFNDSQPVFLCVGTVEIRKNHDLLIRAFERVWQGRGVRPKLVIAGHYGWKASELWNRLQRHPALNDRLFIFENLTDQELFCLYQKAEALLSGSSMEGFGLPVVEAIYNRLPIMLSDIPVHREIAYGKQVEFFRDDAELYVLLKQFGSYKRKSASVIVSGAERDRDWISWRESFEGLLDVIQSSTIGAPEYAERY